MKTKVLLENIMNTFQMYIKKRLRFIYIHEFQDYTCTCITKNIKRMVKCFIIFIESYICRFFSMIC